MKIIKCQGSQLKRPRGYFLVNLLSNMTEIYKTTITKKIADIPIPISLSDAITLSFMLTSYNNPGSTKPIITPPAITDAICPATFAPTACINRWF